ncbi:metallophosphoesterase, partial [Methylobacterium sp. WL103]|uniref:metallophosphoesterase n=1 Tax=Methylobacterium sp. WL103 TaxID=2603891 RepID=UPI0011CACA4D
MRIFPISDLHLERRRLDLIAPPSGPFDVMVCAGDLYEGHPERGLAAVLALAGGRPVVLVPGNHEHYAPTGDGRTAPELLAALAAEVGPVSNTQLTLPTTPNIKITDLSLSLKKKVRRCWRGG